MAILKRKRTALDLEQKMAIIRDIESGIKQSVVAATLNMTKTTVNSVWLMREKIKRMQMKSSTNNCKRMRFPVFEDIEEELLKWLQTVRSQSVPITGPMMREKALEFAKQFKHKSFLCTGGWLDRFKARHGLPIHRRIKADKYKVVHDSGVNSSQSKETVTKSHESPNDRNFLSLAISNKNGDLVKKENQEEENIEKKEVEYEEKRMKVKVKVEEDQEEQTEVRNQRKNNCDASNELNILNFDRAVPNCADALAALDVINRYLLSTEDSETAQSNLQFVKTFISRLSNSKMKNFATEVNLPIAPMECLVNVSCKGYQPLPNRIELEEHNRSVHSFGCGLCGEISATRNSAKSCFYSHLSHAND